jgi:hypothetical protein
VSNVPNRTYCPAGVRRRILDCSSWSTRTVHVRRSSRQSLCICLKVRWRPGISRNSARARSTSSSSGSSKSIHRSRARSIGRLIIWSYARQGSLQDKRPNSSEIRRNKRITISTCNVRASHRKPRNCPRAFVVSAGAARAARIVDVLLSYPQFG